jgi:pimeloyl-ACP methyl ester carboxylesterase
MENIREQTLLLGPRKSLVGIISPAAPSKASGDAPMIVILNSGIIHRVGANRATVSLSRALAGAGFPVLRFDLSGLGDSDSRPDMKAPLESALADIREVLDSLESSRQIGRFILAGLCSGADHSILYAGSDPRVVGLVLLDPSIPRTFRYYLKHYARHLVSLRTWINFVSGRHLRRFLQNRQMAKSGLAPGKAPGPNLNAPEVRNHLEQAYRSALNNGNQCLAIFTAGIEGQHNYREQLLDAFPGLSFGSQLRLAYYADCDHTFTAERHREQLVRQVVDWVQSTRFSMGLQERNTH